MCMSKASRWRRRSEKVAGQKFETSDSTVDHLYAEIWYEILGDPGDGIVSSMLVQTCPYGKGGVKTFSRYDGGKIVVE